MSEETKLLVAKSNELAAIVQELEAKKKRHWDSYHGLYKRNNELEDKVLAGDRSVLEEWLEVRRQLRQFMADDETIEPPLRKAREDYFKAHEAALTALRRDAGLVWMGHV